MLLGAADAQVWDRRSLASSSGGGRYRPPESEMQSPCIQTGIARREAGDTLRSGWKTLRYGSVVAVTGSVHSDSSRSGATGVPKPNDSTVRTR